MNCFFTKSLIVPVLFVAGSICAQSAVQVVPKVAAPAGLLRLQDNAKAGGAALLAPTKFSIDDLLPGVAAGASKEKKGKHDALSLVAGAEWSRPLRGLPRDVSFVSFQLYASAGTIVDIGGVRLGLTASPASGALQLMFDDSSGGTLQWKSFKLHLDTGKFEGKNLAMLPTLTVRLDPGADTWDIYSGSRLLGDNLPLIAARKNQRFFHVRAGTEGAWISSLVMSDENPLYEDDNANGIDDRFEKEKRGVILPTMASVQERKFLAQQWKDAQRKKAPPALHVSRPMPDGAVVPSTPKKISCWYWQPPRQGNRSAIS